MYTAFREMTFLSAGVAGERQVEQLGSERHRARDGREAHDPGRKTMKPVGRCGEDLDERCVSVRSKLD